MNPNQGNNNLFGLNNLDLSSLIASSGLNLNGMNNVNGNQADNGMNQGGFGNVDMSMFQGMGLGGQGGQGMQNNAGLGLGMSMGQQNPQQAQGNPNQNHAQLLNQYNRIISQQQQQQMPQGNQAQNVQQQNPNQQSPQVMRSQGGNATGNGNANGRPQHMRVNSGMSMPGNGNNMQGQGQNQGQAQGQPRVPNVNLSVGGDPQQMAQLQRLIMQSQQRNLAGQQGQLGMQQFGNQQQPPQQQQAQPQQQQQQQQQLQQSQQDMQRSTHQQAGALTAADLRQFANNNMATITRGQQQNGIGGQQGQQPAQTIGPKLNLPTAGGLTQAQIQMLQKMYQQQQQLQQQQAQQQPQQQQLQQQHQQNGQSQLQTPQMGSGQHLLKTPQTGSALPHSSPVIGSESQTPGMWMPGNNTRQNSIGSTGGNGQDLQLPPNWAANMNEQHMNQLRSIYASQQGRLGLTNNPGLPRQLSTGTAGSASSPQTVHQNVQQNQSLNGQQNQQLNAQQMSQNAINMLTPQQRTQLLQVQSQSHGQVQFPNQNQGLNQQYNQMQNIGGGDNSINAQSALIQNGQLPTLPNGLDGMGMYQAISNADLIATAKSMLPKLNSQLKATEAQISSCFADSPSRPQAEGTLAKIHGFRNGLLKEMARRGLDPKSLGLANNGPPGKPIGQSPGSQQQRPGVPNAQSASNMIPENVAARPLQMTTASNGNPSQPSAQLHQQSNTAAANLMATLQLNEATMPRATAFPGSLLQNQRPLPAQFFYNLFASIATRKGLDSSSRYVDGQLVDPFSLFVIVCKFGGHAEVTSKDIWSMIGGAMGYVDVPGPPALSSSEVAQELARIYRELLSSVEEAYVGIVVKRSAQLQNAANNNQQTSGEAQRNNSIGSQAQHTNIPAQLPVASPQIGVASALPGVIKSLTPSADQMMALGLTPEQHRTINEQRQQIAELAKKARLQNDPQTQAQLQQSLMQLSQRAGLMPAMDCPGMPSEQLEKAKARVWERYKVNDPARGLAPLPPGGQEAQGYNDLVERSKTGVYQFDRLLTIVLAIDPSWLNPDRAIQAFDSAAVLKYVADRWEKGNVFLLRQTDFYLHLERIKREILLMSDVFKSFKSRQAQLANPSLNEHAGANPETLSKPSVNANTPVIAPRLRIEDLKPPPTKRQKPNPKAKEEKASPAAASPVKIKAEGDVGSRAASPPQTKRPVPKKKRKPTVNSEPIDVDASTSTPVDLTASPARMEDSAPIPSRPLNLSGSPDNTLGVRLGEQMVQARRQAEFDAQADSITFLTTQWQRLEGALRRHDQMALDNIKADLAIDIGVPFDDALAMNRVPANITRPAETVHEPIPPKAAVAEGFDYSSFFDFDGLADDNESAPTMIAATPDLLGPGDPRFEVSPSSEGPAGTPRQPPVQHHKAPIGTVSPVQEHLDLFGEDGWLTEGITDSKWDENFDPSAAQWNFA